MSETVGNVVEEIRKESSVTQKRLASMSGLSTLYIIRAEQGMSLTLPDNLLASLSYLDTHNRDPQTIQRVYVQQRFAMVEYYLNLVNSSPENGLIIETALSTALDNYEPKAGSPLGKKLSHPLYLFRTQFCALHQLPMSAIKFCQMFGMHPATISKIEKREDTLEKHSVAYDKLKSLGLSAEQMELLCKACDSCL